MCYKCLPTVQFSSVQFSRSVVSNSATPWIAARQASLSITNSCSSLRLMSIGSVMPSSHLILCRPLLLLPPIPPSIRVFSNESTLRMRWPKYWHHKKNVCSIRFLVSTLWPEFGKDRFSANQSPSLRIQQEAERFRISSSDQSSCEWRQEILIEERKNWQIDPCL